MIQISYAEFFVLLTAGLLVYAALLLVRENARVRRNEWQLSNRRLFHCNNCHLSFIPKHPVSLCRCPRCNTVCILRRGKIATVESKGEKDDE